MDYSVNIKIIKELVQDKKYKEAENMLLSTIQEAKVKNIEDENNTYYCFNNYIESLLFWNMYKPQKKNLNPDINYAEVYYYLGFINIEQKNFGKALEYLQEGLKWSPVDAVLMFEEAAVYRMLGNIELSKAKVEKAHFYIYNSPYLAKFFRQLGGFYTERRVFDIANALYTFSLSFHNTELARSELMYIAKQENREVKYSSKEEIETLFRAYNIPLGYSKKTVDMLIDEYERICKFKPPVTAAKYLAPVLYDITHEERYKQMMERMDSYIKTVEENKQNTTVENDKLKMYFQEIENFPTFKFYFPENLGEYVKVDPKIFEIRKDNKQMIRVTMWKCNTVEEHEEKAKKWIEKNINTNKMEQVEYRKETINNIPLEVYVLKYTESPKAANRIYKIGYINNCIVTISGSIINNKEKIINQAFEKLECEVKHPEANSKDKSFFEEWKRDLKVAFLNYEEGNIKETIKYLDRNITSILANDKTIEQDIFWKVLTTSIFKAVILNSFYNKKELTPNDIDSLLANEEVVKKNILEFCNNFRNNENINFINQIEDISDKMLKDVIHILMLNIGKMNVKISTTKITNKEEGEKIIVKPLTIDCPICNNSFDLMWQIPDTQKTFYCTCPNCKAELKRGNPNYKEN